MTSSRPAALIVEDQPFVGLVASDILRELGFETFHAFDAAAADRVLGEHPEIAVMVADADLPGSLTGLDLVRRVATGTAEPSAGGYLRRQDDPARRHARGRADVAQALCQRRAPHPGRGADAASGSLIWTPGAARGCSHRYARNSLSSRRYRSRLNGTISSGSSLRLDPLPFAELGMLGRDVHVAVASPRKRPRYQSWSWPIHLPPHNLPRSSAGKIVFQPLRAFGDPLDQAGRNAGLLLELAQRGRPRLLALVDPALRHLPGLVGIIDPRADEHLALAVEEHHADPAAVLACRLWPCSSRSLHPGLQIGEATRQIVIRRRHAFLIEEAVDRARRFPIDRLDAGLGAARG